MIPDDALALADLLVYYRKRVGLTQKEAASARAGIGSKSISTFETGMRIESIRFTDLIALLNCYQIDLDMFVYDLLDRSRPKRRTA